MLATILGSSFVRGAVSVLAVCALLTGAAWRIDVWAYDRGYAAAKAAGGAQIAAMREAQAKADAEAAKKIQAANDKASQAVSAYLQQEDIANAHDRDTAIQIRTAPGRDTALSAYLASAADLLWPGPSGAGH